MSISILLITNIYGQTIDLPQKKSRFSFLKSLTDSTNKHDHFEVSFGQNLVFISSSKQIDILKEAAVVLPTSSVLFFAEMRPKKVIRIPVYLNIATESKQFLIDGVLVNEKSSPSFGTGILLKMIQFDVDKKSKIELEMGSVANCIVDKSSSLRIVPVLVSRLKICRGENFVMYVGVNYAFGINSIGLLYGTGTVF